MDRIEIHPAYNGYKQNIDNLKGGLLPGKAKIIIMGTFPPRSGYENISPFFYYPSSRNQFWNRIDNILNNHNSPLKFTQQSNENRKANVNRKFEFALKYNIAFMDYFSKISRKNDTSLDSDLINVENVIENEFLVEYLSANSRIARILCTYSLAYDELIGSLKKKNYNIIQEEERHSATGQKSVLKFNGNTVEIIQLYPATRSRYTREQNDNQYKYFIFR